MPSQSERRLRAIIAKYYDVYGCLIDVGPGGREIAAECYEEAVSAHIDSMVEEALRS